MNLSQTFASTQRRKTNCSVGIKNTHIVGKKTNVRQTAKKKKTIVRNFEKENIGLGNIRQTKTTQQQRKGRCGLIRTPHGSRQSFTSSSSLQSHTTLTHGRMLSHPLVHKTSEGKRQKTWISAYGLCTLGWNTDTPNTFPA